MLLFVGLVFGVLILAGGRKVGESSRPRASPEETTPGSESEELSDSDVARFAGEADKIFGATLATVSTAVGAEFPVTIPYLAASGTAVTLSWGRLSKRDKANVWSGRA